MWNSLRLATMTAVLLTMGISVEAGKSKPEAVVKAFAKAADSRDLAALEAILHPDYRVAFLVAGTESPSMMGRDDYLGLAKAGKIGGDRRTVKILAVERQGNLAFIRTRLVGEKATFESMQTTVKTAEGWKLLGESVLFSPKG
ncbi:MAG: DUF4440 domain-containing protein [Myxococcota bacterium]